MKRIYSIVLLSAAVCSVIFILYSHHIILGEITLPGQSSTDVELMIVDHHKSSIYEVPSHKDESALQIMQTAESEHSSFSFKVKEYSFGDLVTTIDGDTPDPSSAYWEFLVNGKEAQVGVSSYIVKKNDIITFIISSL